MESKSQKEFFGRESGYSGDSEQKKLDFDRDFDVNPASISRVASLQQDLDGLRKHVSTLEKKLRNPLEIHDEKPAERPKSQKGKKTHSRKERSDTNQLIAEIQFSEKELNKLQHSLSHSPGRIPNVAIARQIDRMREQLAEERRHTSRLQTENQNLKEKLRKREELQQEIGKLQEEYNALTISFDRSEEIRRKQKILIEELRLQMSSVQENEEIDGFQREEIDQKLKAPTMTVKKRGKARQR